MSLRLDDLRRDVRPGHRVLALHVAAGALLGVLLLHPATMAIYWLQFHAMAPDGGAGVSHVLHAVTSPEMLPMNGLFLLLGAAVGGVFGTYDWLLAAKRRSLRSLAHLLGSDVQALIAGGEDEHTEFKSTARWDLRQGQVNRDLEGVLVKTIASFLNHEGGSLLVGVADDRRVVGLRHDYRTLKYPTRDAFERFVMTLVKDRLGGQMCSYVHPVFIRIGGEDVCRVVVEPCDRPVYVSGHGGVRYYLRTGNATRELDVREAVEHIRSRRRHHRPVRLAGRLQWPGRR